MSKCLRPTCSVNAAEVLRTSWTSWMRDALPSQRSPQARHRVVSMRQSSTPKLGQALGALSEIIRESHSRLLACRLEPMQRDRKSTRLNSSHVAISYAVFCLEEKRNTHTRT